jgi:hypothetical protein
MTIRAAVLASLCLAVVSAAGSGAAGAQQSRVLSGPVVGYVWMDQDKQLRPIAGVPGSATIGAPIDVGIPIAHAMGVDASRVLLSSPILPALLMLDLITVPPAAVRIDAGIVPTLSSASPRGTAAALYDSSAHRVAIVTGLLDVPALAHSLSVLSTGGDLGHLAVSDDGQALAYTVRGSGTTSLYFWTAAQGPWFLGDRHGISAIALAEDGRVVVASGADNAVFLVRATDGSGQWRELAGVTRGVSEPVGVASVGNRVFVANAGSGAVSVFDIAGAYRGSHRCGCDPTGLHRLQSGVYRLTSRLDRTTFLLDARTPVPRLLFVPPGGGS